MWEEIKCHSYSRNHCSSKNEPIDHEFFHNFSELRVDSCPKPFASHPAYEMSKFRKHSVKEMLKRSKMRKSLKGVGHSVNEKKVNEGTVNIENEQTKEEKGNDCIKEDKIDSNSHKWILTVLPKKQCLQWNLHIHQIQVSLQYSRDQLKRFRRHTIIDTTLIAVLKDNDIFRYRGKRLAKWVKERQDLRSQRRWENLNCLNRSHLHSDVNNAQAFSSRPCVHPKASIPSLLISNTCSLTCKVDEFECVTHQNNADIICVTESWLTKDIPVLAIAMSDFMVFRKDRSVSRGGTLAVYVNSTIRCKSLSQFVNPGNVSECLWLQLRPRRLPRSVSSEAWVAQWSERWTLGRTARVWVLDGALRRGLKQVASLTLLRLLG